MFNLYCPNTFVNAPSPGMWLTLPLPAHPLSIALHLAPFLPTYPLYIGILSGLRCWASVRTSVSSYVYLPCYIQKMLPIKVIHHPRLLQSFLSLCNNSWLLDKGVWYRCFLVPHNLFFSTYWPVLGFCVNHHLHQKQASLMRNEQYTVLVKRVINSTNLSTLKGTIMTGLRRYTNWCISGTNITAGTTFSGLKAHATRWNLDLPFVTKWKLKGESIVLLCWADSELNPFISTELSSQLLKLNNLLRMKKFTNSLCPALFVVADTKWTSSGNYNLMEQERKLLLDPK